MIVTILDRDLNKIDEMQNCAEVLLGVDCGWYIVSSEKLTDDSLSKCKKACIDMIGIKSWIREEDTTGHAKWYTIVPHFWGDSEMIYFNRKE